MAKPTPDGLWKAFPDHGRYPTLKDLYTMLGGAAEKNINAPGFGPDGNACASRLSVAFNKGGAPINAAVARSVGARTLGAADGTRIIYGVNEFRAYLHQALGKPLADNFTPFDDAFRKKKGVIAFGVQGWSNATGHIALFRNGTYREASDNYASFANSTARTIRAEFWELS